MGSLLRASLFFNNKISFWSGLSAYKWISVLLIWYITCTNHLKISWKWLLLINHLRNEWGSSSSCKCSYKLIRKQIWKKLNTLSVTKVAYREALTSSRSNDIRAYAPAVSCTNTASHKIHFDCITTCTVHTM